MTTVLHRSGAATSTTISPVKIGLGDVVISDAARANIEEVLATGRLSYGPFTQRFERRFAEMHGRRFAVFMNSGTSALQVGLAAMKEKYGWSDDDGVLVPAVTFVASLNTVVQNGLRPVLVDIEPDFFSMDLREQDSLRSDMRPVVAAMPVHLFGQASPSPSLIGVRVIADSCETMLMPGCADGDVSCFSTYVCHLVNTGVGGFATTDDPELARLIRSLANHGRDGIYTSIDQELGQREVIEGRFLFERLGYSYRATELEAAIGVAELDDLPRQIERRRFNAHYLISHLDDLPLQFAKERVPGQHAYMMFPVVCRYSAVRTTLVQHLESVGIETRPMLPLTNQPYVRTMFGEDVEDRYPVAKRVNHNGFYVPCHPYLTVEDLDRIVRAFRNYFGKR